MGDYLLDGDDGGDFPYVEMQLDIRDAYQIYQSLSFHLNKWPGNLQDPDEQERIRQMRDFFYRVILEFKFSAD